MSLLQWAVLLEQVGMTRELTPPLWENVSLELRGGTLWKKASWNEANTEKGRAKRRRKRDPAPNNT